MTRNDIQGGPAIPKAITDYLLRKEGKNPHGEANFRLVWAPSRITKKGGRHSVWHHDIPVDERGGVTRTPSGLLIPNGHTPIRTVLGVVEVHKYPFASGWVLERWIAPHYYGAKGDWDARVVPGTSIPLGGPFPSAGEYEMCHNSASPEMPSIAELQRAIDRCNHARETHQGSVESMIRERENRYTAEYEAEVEKDRLETEARIKDLISPVFSNSLASGAWRSKVAASMGITEHVGN